MTRPIVCSSMTIRHWLAATPGAPHPDRASCLWLDTPSMRRAVVKPRSSSRYTFLLDTRRPASGIVKLSGIAMIDPQHTGFATGLEPIIMGVGQPDSA